MRLLLHLGLAGLVLFCGAATLWLVSEAIEGKREFILHFGNVMLVTMLGLILFPFWGWRSTAIVLGSFGVLWIIGATVARRRE
jgi:hypothetical protein